MIQRLCESSHIEADENIFDLDDLSGSWRGSHKHYKIIEAAEHMLQELVL